MDYPYAINVTRLGGPEVMEERRMPMPEVRPGEVLVAHTAIGVNFVDIYLRSGQPHSHNPSPPFVPGANAVGRVLAAGAQVSGLRPGDRVAYVNAGAGTYCTHAAVDAERVVRVPDGLSDDRVAAGLLRVLTAQYLLKQIRPLSAGERILVHAAAGGVGQVLVQWAKRLGLQVIATVGSDAKVALARTLGADCVINYSAQDFACEVERWTEGAGVSVVFDSVGRDTFMGSLACLAPRGLVVNYGTASGQVEGFALQALHAKSLSVCRPTLRTYIASRADLLAMCAEAFELMSDPLLQIEIAARLPLRAASDAHRMLESRQTRGSIVLFP